MGTSIENRVNSVEDLDETILSQATRIERFEDYLIHPLGFVISLKKKPIILKEAKTGYNLNYSFVVLSMSGKTYPKYIHRLVAEHFVHNDDPENKTQVNHIDGNTDNNASDNVEWTTPKENSNHAVDTGLTLTGDSCPWAKHSEVFIRMVCSLLEQGYESKEIRFMSGIDSRTLCKIKTRVNWKQASQDFVW